MIPRSAAEAAGQADRSRERSAVRPVGLSLFLLLALFALTLRRLLHATGGRFAYVLDDPYIHLAMARNLARHGSWGLHSGTFANTSSSPLWTALLALCDLLVGDRTITPLLLNLLCAGVLLLVAGRALARVETGPRASVVWPTLALLALLFWTPVAPLVFVGQEHLLHALLALLFLLSFQELWSRPDSRPGVRTLALAALLPLVRYESLFLTGAAALLLFLAGRRKTGGVILLAGVVPISLFGIFCLAHGWYPLPNPVLLKGHLPSLGKGLADFARTGYRQALSAPHLLLLLLAALTLLFVRARGGREAERPDRWDAGLWMFVLATLLHLQFARLRWFYRYEAYLVFLGIFLVAGALVSARVSGAPRRSGSRGRIFLPGRLALLLAVLFPVAALSDRALDAELQVPQAARNIYEQQVQMGLFLRRYYPGARIAANDLGAISYLADVDCLDLWGLASREVARSRLAGTYDRNTIAALAREKGVRIALLYDVWFGPGGFAGIPAGRPGGLPPEWVKVGRWTIADNLVGGDATVSFYAVDPAEADSLSAHLRDFPLPPRVTRELLDPTSR